MYNHVGLLGRLAQEPELRYTQNGVPVASFDLAVQVPSKDKNTPPDYIPIVCWQEQAEFVSRYLTKGRQIVVEGRLSTRKYTGGDGKSHKVVEVKASRICFADSGQGGGGDYGRAFHNTGQPENDRRTTAGQTGGRPKKNQKTTMKGGAHGGMDPSTPTTQRPPQATGGC